MSEGIFRIYINDDNILIHNLVKSKVISIDKNYCSVSTKEISILNSVIISSVFKAFGILGILQVGMYDFLIFITACTKVGNIGSTEIFEIKEINYILISSESSSNTMKLPHEMVSILKNIQNLMTQGFFFSHNYDLTNSLQNQKILKINNSNKFDFIKDANPDFLWNHKLNSKFYQYNIDNDFMISLICGYVGVTSENIDENTFINYILISRRSAQNAGVKKLKRGIDTDGYVANFVETEQILILNQNVFSYVQVRGHAPVFYTKFKADDEEVLTNLFQKHLYNILNNKNYKLLFLINLMNNRIEQEHNLTEIYEKLIQKMNLKNLKYSYFNFDKECKFEDVSCISNNLKAQSVEDILDLFNFTNLNNNSNVNKSNTDNLYPNLNINSSGNEQMPIIEDNIEKILNKMESIFSIFKFFGIYYSNSALNTNPNSFENNSNKIIHDQIGVIRTNCYDGLERSNIIQMRIGWKILLSQLKCLNIDGQKLFGNICNTNESSFNTQINNRDNLIDINDIFSRGLNVNQNSPSTQSTQVNINKHFNFLQNFKKLWSENEEKLNLQFSGFIGIGIPQGESSFKENNEFNSNENYKNEDDVKQRCIDIILHKYNLKLNSINDEVIKKELDNNIDKYIISEELTVFLGSWNVAGQNFKDEISLFEWLNPRNKLKKTPDIYFIGLQEIVELNANYLLLSSNQPKVDYWKNTIKFNLEAIDEYTLIKCLDLVGVFMVFFVKSSLKDKIKNLDCAIIKTGMMGALGNKGSCLIRFNYLDSSFAFSNGHLAAGSSHNKDRVNELTEILNKTFSFNKDIRFKDHNIIFIMGDLNFRVDLDYDGCVKLINSRNLPQLLQYDQLLKSKEVNFNLVDLDEGLITFNPTFKYVIGSQEYDTKKKRVPSWCDRILYKRSKFITQVAYDRAEYTHSDHRPIFSIFNVFAVMELKEKKMGLINEIKQNLVLGIKQDYSEIYSIGNSLKKNFMCNENVELRRFDSSKFYNTNDNGDGDNYVKDSREKDDNEIIHFFK